MVRGWNHRWADPELGPLINVFFSHYMEDMHAYFNIVSAWLQAEE